MRPSHRVQEIDNDPFEGKLTLHRMCRSRMAFWSEWVHEESKIICPMFWGETIKILEQAGCTVSGRWLFKEVKGKVGIVGVNAHDHDVEEDPFMRAIKLEEELTELKHILTPLMLERNEMYDQIQVMCDSLGIERNGPLDQSWITKVADAVLGTT